MAQNSDLIKQAVYEELQKILNPDGDTRKSAEERLSQLKYTEGYGIYLAEITISQSFELALRQLASVMLKQYVEDCWSDAGDDAEAVTLRVTPEAKIAIKSILPEGLYDPNSKIRSVVAYSISNIASHDWPNEWPELFDIIVKCLAGNESSVHGAMKVLVEFTLDLDKQLIDVGPMILAEVYKIFEANTVYSVSTRTYAVEILLSLLKNVNQQLEKQQQSEILNPILPSFMQKMIEGLTVPYGSQSSFALKTQIVKVLNYMVTEMPKFVNPYYSLILPPIWQVLTQMAEIYISVIVNETTESPFKTDVDGDENEEFNTMILQIFEFLNSIIEYKKFRESIKNVLTDLVYIIIIYMQMTENQVQCWSDDPEKFVEDEDEQGIDFSIRTSAHDVLLIVGKEYREMILSSLSNAISKHLTVADANRNAGESHWWKIHEASMLAVGSFKDMIFEDDTKFNLTEFLNMVKGIMAYQMSPYLIGRCLWTLSRYSECDIFNQEVLQDIIDATVSSLTEDKSIVLRISAVRAIYNFCTNLKDCKDERRAIIVSKIEVFFDCMMPLFSQSQNSALGLLLEALAALISYDSNVTAAISSKVMSLTIAIFLKYHEDRFILETVQEILKILSQNPYCLSPLQDKIIPTLVSILNLNAQQTDMHDIALDVLSTVVKYSNGPLNSNVIETGFPAAIHCILRTEDHSVMQSGGECLRAFLAAAPEQICAYNNGQGLNYIMEVTTMLLNPMNTESTAAFIGRLVITIITKIGNLLGEKVDLLLKAVISKMQLVESLNVIMSLVMIFAHLILVQMDAVLNFLSTVPGPTGEPAMSFVFAVWLSRQHLFYGTYERKVSTMALCKLFEYGVTTKDERLNSVKIKEPVVNVPEGKRMTRHQTAKVAQQWIDIPILLKIFKLLINELSNLKEAKEALDGDGGNSDTDDDENSDEGKAINFSALMLFEEEDDDDEDDKQLMQELLQNPIFQCDTQEYLMKFIQSFSTDPHFQDFLVQLSDSEKELLRTFEINIV